MDKQPAQQLYQQIKDDIRNNLLPIGETLKQEALSQRYQVSRIPVRDVLQRLKNEGWLCPCGKRGVMIPPLSAQEAEDLYMMRMYLEPLLLGHAIAKINHQVIGQAKDILSQMEDLSRTDISQIGELNWQFHACLYRAAQRPTLFNTIANLHQQCARYIGYHTLTLAYHHNSHAEHLAIIEAAQDKQVTRAKNLLKAHISDAGELLVEHLNQHLKF